MISFVKDMSINKKLLLIVFVSSFAALLLASFFILLIEMSEFHRKTKEDLVAMTNMVGNRSTAALLFRDKEMAKENLSIFNQLNYFRLACIYDQQGKVFARVVSDTSDKISCPVLETVNQVESLNWHINVVEKILLDEDFLGHVYINVNLEKSYIRKFKFLGLIYLVLFTSALLTFILATPLLRMITDPMERLVRTVKKISSEGDFSLRAEKISNDDLGVLVDSFNTMIGTVEKQQKALIDSKNRFLALYDDNPSIIFNVEPEGYILSVNKFGALQLNHSTNRLNGFSLYEFIDKEDFHIMNNLLESCVKQPKKLHKLELRMRCLDGRLIWVRGAARLIYDENNKKNILLVCEDFSETRNLNEKIAYQASHDALTGLYNRGEFDRQIKAALDSARRSNIDFSLCYLDLDQFKVVNDICGHLAGDELLRQLADLLKKQIRKEDLLARLGGDEFGILMKSCMITEAFKICEKIRNSIRDYSFAWEGRNFKVGVSIGITEINQASANAIESLKEADSACYAAKESGRNRVHIFSPDDEQLVNRRGEMQWVNKLQEGLQENRFCLFGQPIVAIDGSDEGLHFETLVRYLDKEGNIIPPGAFLPAAERYNTAGSMDRWVIRALLKWLSENSKVLDHLTLCAINLSGVSLSDANMLDFIIDQIAKWRIPSNKICFEVTETAAIASLSSANGFIATLKEQGCFFSLDDFGSGLSSFAYLKNLPVDFLKIDGLFVKDILDDEVDYSMVKSINEVGHVLGKKTIAEFVENDQILKLLKDLGVNYAQGYGIGKPVPLNELKIDKLPKSKDKLLFSM